MRSYASPLTTAPAAGLLVPALAQQPPPTAPPDDDEEVVRVTANLVQVDAAVTDRLAGVDPARADAATAARHLTDDAAGVAAAAADPGLGPAVRRLRHGVFPDYGYAVYNARPGKAAGRPRLNTRTRLFRDGGLVSEGASPRPTWRGRRT